MKTVILLGITLLLSWFFLMACSKHSRDDLGQREESTLDVLSIHQSPMPPDSLELDSLRRPGKN